MLIFVMVQLLHDSAVLETVEVPVTLKTCGIATHLKIVGDGGIE